MILKQPWLPELDIAHRILQKEPQEQFDCVYEFVREDLFLLETNKFEKFKQVRVDLTL